MDKYPSASALIAKCGGSYAAQLGICLHDLNPTEIYKWFLAAMLYGARISENIASRTWQIFKRNQVLTPEDMISTNWERLVAMLDQGDYVRYDHKTATKFQAVSQSLCENYAGDFNHLHAAALDPSDLEQRVMNLGKGIGKVTTHIFLRELRGRWEKAVPPLSLLALDAAQVLGFLAAGMENDPKRALVNLQQLWLRNGMPTESFPDFEAALVRYGLRLRRLKKKTKCVAP